MANVHETESIPTATTLAAAPTAPTAVPDAGVDPDADAGSPRHSVLVGIILGVVTASTVAMVGFIWYRWQAVREPTTQIIVDADETFDGTLVNIRGQQQFTTSLSKANNYHAPVLVAPGRYVVTAERNGLPILIKEVDVRRFFGLRFDLVEYVKKGGIAGELTSINARNEAAAAAAASGASGTSSSSSSTSPANP